MDEPTVDPQPTAPAEPPPPPRRSPDATMMWLALTLIVSLVLNGVFAIRVRDAEDDLSTLRARVAAQEESLDALRDDLRGEDEADPVARLASAIAKLRRLEFKTAVKPQLLSTTSLQQRVRTLFERDNAREEIEASEHVLRALGVIADDVDLFALLRDLHEEQVAGFYDSDAKELVIVANDARDPSPLDRVLLAHEMTHALTDQHFDLARLDDLQERDRDDEALAFLSLAEGDAQFTMSLYQRQVLTAQEQLTLIEEARELPATQIEAAPPFLQEVLQFPYVAGLEFVEALHERGGFASVDAAYRDPPSSTEQILHPNRYIENRDEPVAIRLPDLARTLGSGWRRIERGGIGELDLRLIADLGGSPGLTARDARAAADGWDGGAYAAYRSGSEVVVAIQTAWDSESEAREADRAFARWVPLRFRNEGAEFRAGASGRGWDGRTGAGLVARDGDRLVLLVGTARESVERAFGAFSGF